MLQKLTPVTSAAMARSCILIRSGAAAVALFGTTVLIAWYAHWTSFLQLFPDSAAIKFNTGFCFIVCSVGVALLTTRFHRPVVALGSLAALVAIVTLLEYLTLLPSALDQLLIRDYVFSATDFHGRMSPLTAVCFTLAGAGLVLAATDCVRGWRLVVVAALDCIVAVIAIVALIGYAFGIEEAYGWGAYTRMPLHTAAAFLVLSVAFLEWTRQAAFRRESDSRGWLPLVSSVTLMTMIAFVSSVSLRHLKNSYDWQRHTYDVVLCAQTLLGDVTDMQRGTRGYVLTGEQAALEPYWHSVKDSPLQLSELRALTQDNAAQKPRLQKLSTDITENSAYARRLLDVRDIHGIDAAIRLESTGEGRGGTERTRADLRAFTTAERRLLFERTAIARANLFNTTELLVLASVLAAALLVWAHVTRSTEVLRRRRAEVTLRKISTLQTAILNAANYAIISSSVDRVITTFNSTAERWLGYAAADVIGKVAPTSWYDAGEVLVREQSLSAELGYSVQGSFETLVAKARLGQPEENEWTMIRKDGTRFPVWRSVTAQVDDSGTVVGYVSVITDITERKQREAATRLSEERFRRAFDDAPFGMALVSPAGRWLRVNRALCNMLDYSDAELLDRDVQSVTHRDDRPASEELVREALAGKSSPYRLEKRYVCRDGSVFFANLSVSLVRDRDGVPLYFISQIEDITERREVERMKNEFLSTVSHELRTPLTSIRGALGLVDAGVLGELPEKAETMVRIAHQNSERLVRVINDILDVEKISSEKLEVCIESVPVAAFLDQALARHQPFGAKHDVHFVLEAIAADATVLADPHRLMQVMANLLSNAAKFSLRGTEVHVRASARGSLVRVEVEDRGTGIPEAFRGRVFEKFTQADSSSSRRYDGTGLGLSITRDLINLMNGAIGFATVAGEGTTFFFDLPRAVGALQPAQAASPADSARYKVLSNPNERTGARLCLGTPRILYVEDDIDLSQVLDAALEGRAAVVTADTLQAAERLLRESSFALVVLDLGLPDGNGLSLLEELPALTLYPIPVVILSATEVSQEVQHRVAAALVKSRVSETDIVTTILSLLPQKQH